MKKHFSLLGRFIHKSSIGFLKAEKLQLLLTSAMTFVCVLFLMAQLWPIHDANELAMAAFLILFIMFVVICVSRCALLHFFMFLAKKFEPFAEYESNKEKTKREIKEKQEKEEKKNKSSDLGSGPVAEVSFKYFIELEKEKNIYNAKYVGLL